MCSLESELESQMGEFHVKMKGESLSVLMRLPVSYTLLAVQFSFSLSISYVLGLAGFARLCAGDQYEVRHQHEHMQRTASLFLILFYCLFLHYLLNYFWPC